MLKKIVLFFEKKIFINRLQKLGEREYFKRYCGVPNLKSEDCKHEDKRVCKITTDKGDINSLYCLNCGAVLAVEALLNNINFEYAKAIAKSNKELQKQSLQEVPKDKPLDNIN
jgi:hypothetical protein